MDGQALAQVRFGLGTLVLRLEFQADLSEQAGQLRAVPGERLAGFG